jgi:2'-5' RNA ligase
MRIRIPASLRWRLQTLSARFLPARVRRAVRVLRGKPRVWTVAFVALPSDEVHNRVSALQARLLEKHGATIALPHLTLKLGFDVTDLEPYERYFDALSKDVEPIEIRLAGISRFDEERYEEGIIFVDVEHNPSLEALRRRILGDLRQLFGVSPYPVEDDRFHFHITLAYDLPERRFLEAYEELKSVPIRERFVLRRLCLLCHTGEAWVSYRQAEVGGAADRGRADRESHGEGADG